MTSTGATGPTGPQGTTGPSGDWKMHTFDLTSTDNATFTLRVSILNNKITGFYVNEYVKSILFEGVKLTKQPMSGIVSNLPDKIEWFNPPSGEGYTEAAKCLMKEAEDIIKRLIENNIFY